jgi:3-phenylpropionate/trans-cinnamate dioxygenase ferredoxin subunit
VTLSQGRWFQVGAVSEVPAEGLKQFAVGGLDIVVANHAGRFYAFQAKCPHLGGPLKDGKLVRSTTNKDIWVDCPWHHYLFEISTGENFYPKSVYPDDLKDSIPPLRVFPVREVNGQLEIEIVSGLQA